MFPQFFFDFHDLDAFEGQLYCKRLSIWVCLIHFMIRVRLHLSQKYRRNHMFSLYAVKYCVT